MTKIPQITARFWAAKTAITAACVFWPDFLFDCLGTAAATAVIALVLTGALAAQLPMAHHRPRRFWAAIAAVGVAGTEAANGLHLAGVPYVDAALVWLVILVALLALWRRSAGAIALDRVDSAAAERYFWACALAASAIGTALVHMTPLWLIGHPAVQVLVWSAAVTALAAAYRRIPVISVGLFWTVFVLTRPLGTGFAFLVSDPHHIAVIRVGPVWATALFTASVLLVVETDARRA